MDGIFIQKKTNLWSAIFFLCCALIVFMYLFAVITDSEAPKELIVLLILGAAFGLVGIFPLLFNHKAFIRIEENAIRARYHWFGRLDCSIDQVEFASAQLNTLTILLKNGKRHTIMGVENSWSLRSAIRRLIFTVERETPDALRQQLQLLQDKRKKELYWVLSGSVLMFVNIFLAVLATGGREMHVFSKLDWYVFAGMCVAEVLTLTVLFYAASRCGKLLLPIEQLKHRLQGALILAQPLPSGNIQRVYTDENHHGRVIICGFPKDAGVYYCVQEFMGSYELETVRTSEIFESEDALPSEIEDSFIDISSQFL